MMVGKVVAVLLVGGIMLVFMAFTSIIALLGLAMLEDQFESRAIAHIVGPNFDLSVLVGTIIIAALSLAWAVYRNGFHPAGIATPEAYVRSISRVVFFIAGSAMLLFFCLMILNMFQRAMVAKPGQLSFYAASSPLSAKIAASSAAALAVTVSSRLGRA
jgi:hypothetical protein